VKKIFAVTILSLLLAACGSSGEGSNENVISSDSTPSLFEISGVWDASEVRGQLIDVRYLVIYSGGFIATFDYEGDSVDQGENCYRRTIDKIADHGFGDFEITSELEGKYFIKAELSGNELTLIDVNEVSKKYPELTLLESDLSDALCD